MKSKFFTKEVITYIIFGILTTIVNQVVFFASLKIMGENVSATIPTIIAWIVAVVFAYITNKLYVFQSKSWEKSVVLKESLSFFTARAVSLVFQVLWMLIFVDMLNLHLWLNSMFTPLFGSTFIETIDFGENVWFFAGNFFVMVMNYFFSKLFIFKEKEEV